MRITPPRRGICSKCPFSAPLADYGIPSGRCGIRIRNEIRALSLYAVLDVLDFQR